MYRPVISRTIEKLFIKHLLFKLFFISFLFIPGTLVFPQSETDTLENYSTAYVKLDGYHLLRVRGTSSFPAVERARAISERIENAAKNYSLSPELCRVVKKDGYDEIVFGNQLLMRIFDSDAALEDVSRETFSIGVKLRVIKAIYSYRYERTYNAILKNLLYSSIAIVICSIVLFIIHFLIRRVNFLLDKRLKKRFEAIESKSFQLIRSNQILITISGFIKTFKFLLFIVIIFFTVQYIFGLFPWTRSISFSLLGLFIKPFSDFGLALINFIPDLAFIVAIFFITRYLLKLVRLFFHGLGQGSITISGFDPDWAVMTYKVARIFLIAFAVIVAYPYIPGSESEAFKGVSLFLGILFSLGSTSVIGNLIAGYTMTYRKTFKIGDVVQIDNNTGRVVEIKLFVTRLHTPKNEEIVIPNSVVLNNNVINYSTLALEKGLILHTTVGIGYETPWRLVEEMLKQAAERTEGILKELKAFVLQKSLGDFAVTYELNAYTHDAVNRLKTYSELHQHILDVFNENNVQIMTPAYEGDPESPKIVPKDQWFTPAAGNNEK